MSSEKVGLISDIHMGYDEISDEKIISGLEKLNSSFTEMGINTVILLGDLIHEETNLLDKRKLKAIKNIFYDKTLYATAGNHDVNNLEIGDFYGYFENTHTFKFELADNICCVITDSAFDRPDSNLGKISPKSMKSIEKICKSDKYDEVIIFTHFLLGYTDQYKQSEYFHSVPEAVFAVNKWHLNNKIDETDSKIHYVSGHIHQEIESYETDKAHCHILNAFGDVVGEKDVLGNYGLLEINNHGSVEFMKRKINVK